MLLIRHLGQLQLPCMLMPHAWLKPIHLQGLCFDIIHHPLFPGLIVTVVTLNMALLCAYWYGQPRCWTRIYNGLDAGFVFFYVLEAACKILAAGRFK